MKKEKPKFKKGDAVLELNDMTYKKYVKCSWIEKRRIQEVLLGINALAPHAGDG